MALLALLGFQALGGCALNYAEGQERERQKRWEEALISYRLALIEDPDDEDYQAAVLRASRCQFCAVRASAFRRQWWHPSAGT